MFVTLDYIVKNKMVEDFAEDARYYKHYLQLGVRCIRDLNLFTLRDSFKSKTLTVQKNLTARLPDDYVYYSAIGVCRQGRMVEFDLDLSICLPGEDPSTVCDLDDSSVAEDASSIQDSELSNHPFYAWQSGVRGGKLVGEHYGTTGGVGTEGFFRIDQENNRIQFSSTVEEGDEIKLEYKSNGIDAIDGDIMVPEQATESVIAFINWKSAKKDKAYPVEKRDLQTEYLRQKRRLSKLEKSYTYQEYYRTILRGYNSSIKR